MRTRWWLPLASSRFPVTCTAVTIFPLKIIFPLQRGGAEVTVITQCWWKLCEAFNHAALVPHEDTAGRLMHRTNVFMITKGEQTSSDKNLKAKLLSSCFSETQRTESHLQTFSWPDHQLVGLATPQNLPPPRLSPLTSSRSLWWLLLPKPCCVGGFFLLIATSI